VGRGDVIDGTVTFLGAGNMAEALLKGLLRAGMPKERVTATVKRQERKAELEATHHISVGFDNAYAAKSADTIVLCAKPQAMRKLVSQIAPAVNEKKLIISIAAGVPIEAFERALPKGARLIRAMPNTPCLVGAGATAIARGEHATDADLELATRVFAEVGITVSVEEGQIDAATGLSGSGPAYIFLIIEALSDAGVKVGLSRQISTRLAAQTVLGSARLLIETGQHPGHLKDQVTSPGGTAIAGLHTLEAGGLRNTLIDAVEAASRRARELGETFLEEPDTKGKTP
jgi:pyrroline-5-carboxylate reductase